MAVLLNVNKWIYFTMRIKAFIAVEAKAAEIEKKFAALVLSEQHTRSMEEMMESQRTGSIYDENITPMDTSIV